MILAIAVLGLSASLVAEEYCEAGWKVTTCISVLNRVWASDRALRTARYCVFLGLYGIVIAAVGLASLFVERIPSMISLVGDSLGVLFYLAGGIAWVVNLAALPVSCGYLKEFYSGLWFADSLKSACMRCEADHGLMWALFAVTACLAICDFVRRRDLVQSSK